MMILLAYIHVHADDLDAFKAATRINASNSVNEPGCTRFEIVQQQDDPTRFVLIEAYRKPEDFDAHKTTAHYLAWRDTVASMMASPRHSLKYNNVHPDDANWR